MSALPLLDITGLAKHFGAVRALDGVSLSVQSGEIFGLIGPNGSGKTTLFNCVTGFHFPTAGTVHWLGRDVTGQRADRLVRFGLVRTFQEVMTFGSETVTQNVVTAGEGGGRRQSAGKIPVEADHILDFCGLRDIAHVEAGNLAYGQARTLGIAMALATQPQLLMLDEPASGLNDSESAELRALLHSLNDDGLTLLVIDHDMSFLLPLVDRVAVLDTGQKLAEGRPEEIRHDPAVIEAYLGKGFTGVETRPRSAQLDDGKGPEAKSLVAHEISAGYGGPDVLQGVSLEVQSGESVAILGANGAGKTSLIRAVSGVLPLTDGEFHYGQVSVEPEGAAASESFWAKLFTQARRAVKANPRNESRLFDHGLVHVPEDRHVFMDMTIRDNLLVAARRDDEATSDRLDWVLDIFPALKDKLALRGGELSGGQQQMLAIGRGLMSRPQLLCLDEPSLGLAPILMQTLTESIALMRRESDMSLLIVEQSAPMALELTDRVYIMRNGRLIHESRADEISVDDLTEGYFGGSP